jgi:hypothetical protein
MTNDQAPMTKQTQITKADSQQRMGHWNISHWKLFGHWCLVIGASSPLSRTPPELF